MKQISIWWAVWNHSNQLTRVNLQLTSWSYSPRRWVAWVALLMLQVGRLLTEVTPPWEKGRQSIESIPRIFHEWMEFAEGKTSQGQRHSKPQTKRRQSRNPRASLGFTRLHSSPILWDFEVGKVTQQAQCSKVGRSRKASRTRCREERNKRSKRSREGSLCDSFFCFWWF